MAQMKEKTNEAEMQGWAFFIIITIIINILIANFSHQL